VPLSVSLVATNRRFLPAAVLQVGPALLALLVTLFA